MGPSITELWEEKQEQGKRTHGLPASNHFQVRLYDYLVSTLYNISSKDLFWPTSFGIYHSCSRREDEKPLLCSIDLSVLQIPSYIFPIVSFQSFDYSTCGAPPMLYGSHSMWLIITSRIFISSSMPFQDRTACSIQKLANLGFLQWQMDFNSNTMILSILFSLSLVINPNLELFFFFLY